MSQGGGGWTQVFNVDTNDGNYLHYQNTTYWTSASAGQGSAGSSLSSDYKNLTVFNDITGNDLLVMAHTEGSPLAWRSWSLSTAQSMAQITALPTNSDFTSASTGSQSTASLDTYEAIVRPNSQLRANWLYGYTTSTDYARFINLAAPALSAPNNSDDTCAGIGVVMNVSNGTNGSMWDAGYGWDGLGGDSTVWVCGALPPSPSPQPGARLRWVRRTQPGRRHDNVPALSYVTAAHRRTRRPCLDLSRLLSTESPARPSAMPT